MKFQWLLFLLLVLLLTVDAQRRKNKSKGKKKKHDCKFSQVDKCYEPLKKFTNESESSVLTTEKGIDDVCTNSIEAINCLKRFIKSCGTKLHQEVFDYVLESFFQSIDKFCKPGKLRTKFLEQSPCIHEKVLSQEKYKPKCVDPFLATVERVNKLDDLDDRTDTVCCSYLRWKYCFYNQVSEICGENAQTQIDEFIDKAFGGLARTLCNEETFDHTSEKCNSLYEKEGVLSTGSASDNPITRMIALYFGFLFK